MNVRILLGALYFAFSLVIMVNRSAIAADYMEWERTPPSRPMQPFDDAVKAQLIFALFNLSELAEIPEPLRGKLEKEQAEGKEQWMRKMKEANIAALQVGWSHEEINKEAKKQKDALNLLHRRGALWQQGLVEF